MGPAYTTLLLAYSLLDRKEVSTLQRLHVPLVVIPDTQGAITQLRVMHGWLDAHGLLDGRTIALLGDYLDRGESPRDVVQFVMELVADGALAIRGNHEDITVKAFLTLDCDDDFASKHPAEVEHWFNNFFHIEDNTLLSYSLSRHGKSRVDAIKALRDVMASQGHLGFLMDLPAFTESWHENRHMVLTHAGVLPHVPWHMQRTDLERSLNSLLEAPPQIYSRDLARLTNHTMTGQQVISGHSPRETPFVSAKRVMLDCGAGKPGRPLVAWVSDTNQVVKVYPDGSISSTDPD